MLEKALHSLDLRDEEIKIYFKLLEQGSTTAGELAKKIGIVRTTLYTTLQRMTKIGVVSRSLSGGVRRFAAVHPEKVGALFEEKITNLKKYQEEYNSALPELIKKVGGKLLAPKIQIYEGVAEAQNVFKDVLMYPGATIYSFWPTKSMVNNLGPDFLSWYNKERIKMTSVFMPSVPARRI